MRERKYKFRAWSEKEKHMIDWFTMSQSAFNRDNTQLMYDLLRGCNPLNVILMQYTGLKDTNGKEIYEGDIIEFKEHGFFDCGVVEYNAPEFEIDRTLTLHKYGGHNLYFLLKNTHGKVIGNIYENPKLLKGKK